MLLGRLTSGNFFLLISGLSVAGSIMAITAVTLKWSVLVLPTFEVEIIDRLVLAIFLLISLLLFAILSLASLFLFAIFMSLVSLFKYGIALFGLGLVYFFNELISLRFYIYMIPQCYPTRPFRYCRQSRYRCPCHGHDVSCPCVRVYERPS